MQTLLAWAWTPILIYALAFGLGLLAVTVTRLELHPALVPPVGLALAVALVSVVYRLGGTIAEAAPLLVLAALAGLLLGRGRVRELLNPGWAGWAALAGYLLYLGPIVVSGHWTWGGYNFVNDTASNLIYADWVSHHGLQAPPPLRSSTDLIAHSAVHTGYPLGAHMLLGTLRPLAGAPLAALYQPFIAAAGALGAMSFTALASRAGLPSWRAALAGVLPLGATLMFNYGLHGGIKEVLVSTLLATAAALALLAAERELDTRLVALALVCVLAMVSVFSVAIGASAAVLAVLVLAAAFFAPERPDVRRLGRRVAIALGVALVVALPLIKTAVDFGSSASRIFANSGGQSTAFLGQLLQPIPFTETGGIWLARDYRAPVVDSARLPNTLLIVVVALLVLAGIFFELRGRRPSASVLFAAGVIPALILSPGLGPYADAKLLVVLTPAVVLLAAVGALSLAGAPSRLARAAGIAGVALMVAGLLVSDGLGYRNTRLAPQTRMLAMQDAARHAPGGGLWLFNEWEEFGKFFMRSVRMNAASESASPKPVQLRRPRPIFGEYFDLDEQRLAYVTGFAGIVTRRSPVASRPPASYRLIHENGYYDVWRRTRGVSVIRHLPLQSRVSATSTPRCPSVLRLAQGARPGDRLVAARRPAVVLLDTRSARRSPAWKRSGTVHGVVVPAGSGSASGAVTTRGGRFRVWMQASTGRPIGAYVDGRRVGSAYQVNTPAQWLSVGTLRLRPGRHTLELRRGGRRLAPGDGYTGVLGPLALAPLARERLETVTPARARSLCGRPWDWIELVRGRAR